MISAARVDMSPSRSPSDAFSDAVAALGATRATGAVTCGATLGLDGMLFLRRLYASTNIARVKFGVRTDVHGFDQVDHVMRRLNQREGALMNDNLACNLITSV